MSRKTTAYARNRAHKPPRNRGNAMLPLLLCSPLLESEIVTEKLKIHSAIADLKTGKMTHEQYNHCAVIFNAISVMAEDISPDLYAVMAQGVQALIRVKARTEAGKSFALDGAGLQAMPALLNVFDAIIENSSPLQLQNAILKSHEFLTGVKPKWKN